VPDEPPSLIDTSVAHPARRYNYWLGGKDNFAADRESGDQIAAVYPSIRTTAIENRAVLRRAVTYLTRDAGIRQFLDVGTGIPTANNTHEVAQALAPDARVVYADNDPIVLHYARALLTSTPQGRTAYLEADLHDPDAILASAEVADILDFQRPVALMLMAVLHFFGDDERPYEVVRRLVDALPSGSYLVMTHATFDFLPPELLARFAELPAAASAQGKVRTRDEVARFFAGLDLVDPGVTLVSGWRPETSQAPRASEVACYGAVGRVP
jgi:SAM-dependent methyltransferase